ncbi:class I lanthipeptide [Maribacter sp. 2-571]|uniref:class I lanthipeptide n=1 Tax=Maribacter sp. 2-571 TaxID=3417569 RepID=UPI003D32E8C3
MKKMKKIGLSLNKRVISNLEAKELNGGVGSGLNMPVNSCNADQNPCYGDGPGNLTENGCRSGGMANCKME